MRVNYAANAATQFAFLSDDQCEEIYLGALRVVEETGVEVLHEEALEILHGQGCAVHDSRVYIPSHLVESAQLTAPSAFKIYSREGAREKDVLVSPNHVNYGPSATATHTFDPRDGQRRKYLRADAANTARVCDALHNIDYTASMGTISDVDADLADVYEFAEMIANSGKPPMAWSYSLEGCRDIHQMAVAVAGGQDEFLRHPNYFFFGEPMPPLRCSEESVDKILYCARHGVPMVFAPVEMSGASTPVTLAGGVVMSIADSILGLVLTQIVRPGTPVVIGGTNSVLDMRTSLMSYGAPELSILCGATAEVTRYMGLPHWSTAGATDAKVDDNQAALEGAISILFAGLSGSGLIHNVGFLEACLSGSLRYLVMMDEAIGWAKRVFRGIEVNMETLAVDVIDAVGPGGEFVTHDHTLRHFKSETWYPTLMDRRHRDDWEHAGGTSMRDRAQEKLEHILDNHQPAPTASHARATIAEILEGAERRIADA